MPNPVQAAAEGMPAINRRRLLGGIVAASAASAVAGGSVAFAATVQPDEPKLTRSELANWHMRELERLVQEDGGSKVNILVTGDYRDNSGYRGCRLSAIIDGRCQNKNGMFAEKGGAE